MTDRIPTKSRTSPSCLGFAAGSLLLLICYLFLGPPRYVEFELINELFWLLLIPMVLIPATILAMLAACTLLRYSDAIERLLNRAWISLAGIVAGVLVMSASGTPPATEWIEGENGPEPAFGTLNPALFLAGWILTAFFLANSLTFLRIRKHLRRQNNLRQQD